MAIFHLLEAALISPLFFIDSTGRAYALAAHSLPSARGQGEPITGRVTPPAGSTFKGVMMGDEKQLFVLASSAGYGFVCPFGETITKNRNGKAVLKAPNHSVCLSPQAVDNIKTDLLVMVSNIGRMLVFPVKELPQLNKGKGNKMLNIPTKALAGGEECMQGFVVISEKGSVTIHSGKRHITLKAKDLEHYQGERGRRGNKLPRGFQKVTLRFSRT